MSPPRHRASGRAVVTIDGKDFYLRTCGTRASRDEYDRWIAAWLANGRSLATLIATANLTIMELLRDFLKHAKSYYRRPDGTATNELKNFLDARLRH